MDIMHEGRSKGRSDIACFRGLVLYHGGLCRAIAIWSLSMCNAGLGCVLDRAGGVGSARKPG